ncbi:MAG TPA: hypothetical protein VKV32_18875 [Stellaceae bacterium]|nr:hypothetical protein [Stellaceae bacterium]
MASILSRLKAAGCRVDGLRLNPDNTVTYLPMGSGPWTAEEKQKVFAVLGLLEKP